MSSPRIVIAGTSSGVGKTSISLGMAGALVQRGLRVQPFKVGPDFLDPHHLTTAAGRTCVNLDSWMTDAAYVSRVFVDASRDSDISLIEGVMGMFDGADPTGIAGSTAEVAAILSSPVVLVVNTHGLAGSIAPLVKGFVEFHRGATVAGVIANNCGSGGHVESMRKALAAAILPPLIGAIPRDSLPHIPSRHLGLVTPGQDGAPENLLSDLTASVSKHVDLDAVLAIARAAPPFSVNKDAPPALRAPRKTRIGLAMDKAFFFYYPDNFWLLERNGASLVRFSPLTDATLPEKLDALYIGGGYPEEYAMRLSANTSMLISIRDFAGSGAPIYAECGGLMYLGESLRTKANESYPMAGVLPCSTVMHPRLRTLGYVEATFLGDSILGRKGTILRGHEFHYSAIEESMNGHNGWENAYTVRRRAGPESTQGFLKGNILAGYIHLHFGSNAGAAPFLVEHISRRRNEQQSM